MIKKIIYIYLAYVLTFFQKSNANKELYLVGGSKGEKLDGSPKAMYDYLEKKSNVNVFFIFKSEAIAKNYPAVKNYLILGSFKSYKYVFKANVILFSHSSNADIAPYIPVLPLVGKKFGKKKLVFLQHGVYALKKYVPMDGKREKFARKMMKQYDVVLTTFDKEVDFVTQTGGREFDKNIVYTTGLPRFDMLDINENKREIKKILFFPTWRSWINNKEDFIKSEYYERIKNFLTSTKLSQILEENNIILEYKPHQLIKEHVNSLVIDTKNIIINNDDLDIFKYIKESDLLITDYSSVTFDFIFQRKNTLLYCFDYEKYLKEIGSYIDIKEEFQEYMLTSLEDLLCKLNDVINCNDCENNFLSKKFIKFSDHKNCERVFNIIKEVD